MEVLNLIFPVFAVIVTGYLVARFKVLPATVAGGLVQFVYYIAIPALLFVIIAQQEIGQLLDGSFALAFGGVIAAVAVVVLVVRLVVFKADLGSATMVAMLSVACNTGIIGLPLLHSIFGAKVTVLAALANIIVVALFTIQVILLESVQSDDAGSKLKHVKNACVNPVVLSTLLGLAYAATPWSLPKLLTDYLNIFGSALTPCALFAVGMSINLEAIAKSGRLVITSTVIKLLVLPALALLVTRLLETDALVSVAAVISAALPTAKTEFILAGQYHQEEDVAAQTVSVTTALAVVTLAGWIIVMSHLFPGAFTAVG